MQINYKMISKFYKCLSSQLPWLSPTAMAGIDGQTVMLWSLTLLPTTVCSKDGQIYDADAIGS